MDSIKEYFDHWGEEFSQLTDRREMLESLIELGKELPEFPAVEKTLQNKVPGCISGVYISTKLEHGRLQFQGHSESLVVRGYVKLLCEGCSNVTPKDFLEHAESIIEKFLKETKMSASLVTSRADAFGNIFRFMKEQVQGLTE